uniref:hypothetical protein n=1 Tax=Pseudomonas viridiflava TaxID=33069 RepID=UPI003C6E492C
MIDLHKELEAISDYALQYNDLRPGATPRASANNGRLSVESPENLIAEPYWLKSMTCSLTS